MRAAAKGATKPYTSTFIATAKETCSRPQPKESSSGIISTDEAHSDPCWVQDLFLTQLLGFLEVLT